MQQYLSIAKTMNGKAPKRCRQKRVLMIPAHYRIKASDAEGRGGARRHRRRTSAEHSPPERQRPFARSIPAVYYNLIFYVPVVELDTIKASDAFGPGSSPGGHTKKAPSGLFFMLFSAVPGRRPLRRPHPAAALHKSVDKRPTAAYNLVRLRDGGKSETPRKHPRAAL